MSDILENLGKTQKWSPVEKIVGYVRRWGTERIPRKPDTAAFYRLYDTLANQGLPQNAASVIAKEICSLRERVAALEGTRK